MRETARFAWVVMALALATVPMPVRWAMTTGFDGMWWPEPPRGSNGFLGTTNMVVNATGEKVGVVFQVPRTGTLNKIEYRTGTVNTPESNRVSFQDVDLATGFPDGTADQFRAITPSANSWNVPGVMTDDGTDTGAKRSVTRGEWLSAVVEFESTVGSQINVCRTASNTVSNIFGPAYQVHDTGSGWAVVSCDPIMALQYSDGTYAFVSSRVWPINGSASTAFSTSSSPDERGNRISIPAPVQLSGVWAIMDLDNNADIVVYDAGDSAVCTINMDANLRSGTSDGIFEAYCPSVVSLSASVYRVVVKPTTVVSMDVGWFTTASADLMGGAPGGTGIYYTQRTDGGSWTDTTTQRALMGLILSGAEDGAGGGGGEVSLPFVAFARP